MKRWILVCAAIAACGHGRDKREVTALAAHGDTVAAVMRIDDEHVEVVTCAAAKCEPSKLATLDGTSHAVALDDDAVYVVTTVGLRQVGGKLDASLAKSRISRVARKDGAVTTLLELPLEHGEVMRLALAGDTIYMTADGPAGGAIAKLSKAGGVPENLAVAPSQHPFAIALDDHYIYWTAGERGFNSGVVSRVPLYGGPPQALARSRYMARGLALAGDTLFFTTMPTPGEPPDGAELDVIASGGSRPRMLLGDVALATVAAATPDRAYVFVQDGDRWQLEEVPLQGEPIVRGTGSHRATGIALTPAGIVWSDEGGLGKL